MAGGMQRRRHGLSLADRAAGSGLAAPPPAGEESPGQARPRGPGGHGRHCWVHDPPGAPGNWPGLLVEWRQQEDGWRGRVAYTVTGAHGPVLVEAWLAADRLTQG